MGDFLPLEPEAAKRLEQRKALAFRSEPHPAKRVWVWLQRLFGGGQR